MNSHSFFETILTFKFVITIKMQTKYIVINVRKIAHDQNIYVVKIKILILIITVIKIKAVINTKFIKVVGAKHMQWQLIL